MPSEESRERVAAALEAVSTERMAFRSSLVVTIEEVRGLLDARETRDADRGGRLADELGTFAAGRIDSARLAELLIEPHRVGTAEAQQIERALDVLRSLQADGDAAFVSTLDTDDTLTRGAGRALAELGRAFGAARVVELVRDGLYKGRDRDSLERFPFRRWNRAERAIAPPLILEIRGADLCAGGLAEYLDGSQKIVLVVDGETPPAALTRLITPGVLVIQTDDPADLARLGECPGPAVAALVPATAARFTHAPAADGGPGALMVERLPAEDPRRPIGERSVFQQREELRQLRALTRVGPQAGGAPGGVAKDGTAAAELDPAGKLAAWLLGQADVSDLSADAG